MNNFIYNHLIVFTILKLKNSLIYTNIDVIFFNFYLLIIKIQIL